MKPPHLSSLSDNVSPAKISYRRYGKRLFDFLVSGILLLLLAPVMAGVTILVLLFSGRPILFKQDRPGLHGKIFKLNKFRTMRLSDDQISDVTTDKQRLTPLGALLRRMHLDELPQLTNVLMGEMSLVGPRPLLIEYLARYTPEQARRHEVLPGMTGWAQVNGGNRLPWEDKFQFDLWYVEHLSFWLDLRILGKTVLSTAKRINTPFDELTTTEFMGSDSK